MRKLTILTSADALIESLISKAYKKALDFYNQEMEVIIEISCKDQKNIVLFNMMIKSKKCKGVQAAEWTE